MSLGRDQLLIAASNIRAGTVTAPNPRRAFRRQLANLVNAGNEWLARFDAQSNEAPAKFAESRAGQFASFEASLPDITVGAADPDDTQAP